MPLQTFRNLILSRFTILKGIKNYTYSFYNHSIVRFSQFIQYADVGLIIQKVVLQNVLYSLFKATSRSNMGFKCKLCKESGRGLFCFPNVNDGRRSEWLTVCKLPTDSSLEVTRHLRICFRHFNKKDLDYHGVYIKAKPSKI